ncbi:Rossmann-fold NAD(P)-binding domain-containing protein [Falsibacillus albus]|uniref:NAD(P)-dependent oxidoreductase n=1 Tax=Falsibacillus albus TaxID=2478915 RepID=A0A3L7K2C2_9BACI|nr:NAD(P)-dependent oxidoreductase [Falsibacillus albus]RLQ97206.1 NAD(P)-dependent oxidoreductase [Falsibacillus albus]
MEQAVVLCAGQFIGFAFCKELLNRGYTVTAVDHEEWFTGVQEEKWLEFGRNSNIRYIPFDEWNPSGTESSYFFIPIYDYISTNNADGLMSLNDKFGGVSNLGNNRCVLLEPHRPLLSEHQNEADRAFDSVKSAKSLIKVFLPTIYGPWQPSAFAFYKLIENKHPLCLGECSDSPPDAIFIDDAANAVLTYLEETDDDFDVVLNSGRKNEWLNGLKYLDEKFKVTIDEMKPFKRDSAHISLSVKSPLSIEEGLERQKTWQESQMGKGD